MTKFCVCLKIAALLGIGALAGMLLGPISHHSTPVAAQEKRLPSAEEQVRKLKLDLPTMVKPANTYVPAVRVGDLLFVSGTIPWPVNGKSQTGRLGQDFDIPKGQAAARQVGLQMLSVVKAELGSLDKVQRLVKANGFVNATADFAQHSQVMNAFSDLMVDVFGQEAGKATRCAIGVSSLPGGSPIEVDAVFQIRN